MDENERPSEMPQNIGRYQVLESVGFGAMGAVYKAFDPLIKRTLAIKTIRLDIPRQSPQYKSFIDRFYHEARISGTLSHPNIVTLFDIGEENGLPYLAMEFVEGETILSILERGQRFKPEKVIGLVSQIASAIDYAHSKGVIHRDIKPSNVILYEGEKVKVTDFGIAKLVDAEMTQSGTLLGTPSYMSPEQAMGEKLDGRSDIFSLGVCAFEMLSGEQPFPGTNVTSILYKLVHVDPIEPTDLEMHGLVPQKWHEVFSKVLAKKPDDRYQTATEFVQDLEYCLGSWFGAVPDMTLSESAESTLAGKVAAAAATPPDARKTGPRAPVPPAAAPPAPPADEPVEVTVSMPSPGFDDRRPRAAAQDEVAPTTMFMSAREVAEAGQPAAAPPPPASVPPAAASSGEIEGTVVMAAPVDVTAVTRPRVEPAAPPPPAPAPAPTQLIPAVPPAAPPPGETEGTVVMASPMAHPTPKTEPVPMPPPPPPVHAIPAVPPAAPRSGETEGTVVMASPMAASAPPPSAPAAPAYQAHYGPAPSSAEPEGTLVMAAPSLPSKAPPPSPPPPPAAAKPSAPTPPPVPPMPPAATMAPPIPQVVEATADAAPAVRRGIPIALLAGGGGLILLAGAVGIGVVLMKNRQAASPTPGPTTVVTQPTPTTAPTTTVAPVAVEGSLHVETQPAGATVTVDGVVRGVTPVDVPGLPLGTHAVKIEQKGFATEEQSVDITADAPAASINLALSKAGPAMGSADFTTNPPGAAVKLDGASIGKTPLRNYRVKLGSHRVEYTADGYEPWSGNVSVREGRKAKIDIFLKAVPKATPTPSPTPEVVDPNRIYEFNQVDTPPQKVSGGSAGYPKGAPKLKDKVSVAGVVVVSEHGDVTDVKIVESGGAAVDTAVAAAVRNWKFTPGVKKGIKVKVRMPFRQTFLPG